MVDPIIGQKVLYSYSNSDFVCIIVDIVIKRITRDITMVTTFPFMLEHIIVDIKMCFFIIIHPSNNA